MSRGKRIIVLPSVSVTTRGGLKLGGKSPGKSPRGGRTTTDEKKVATT